MLLTWKDSFIDANGTLLQNHTPDVGLGGYTHDFGPDATIQGNQLILDNTAGFTNFGYTFGPAGRAQSAGVKISFAIPTRGSFLQISPMLSNKLMGTEYLAPLIQCFADDQVYVVDKWSRTNGNGLLFSLQLMEEADPHIVEMLAADGRQWVYLDGVLILQRQGTDAGIFGRYGLQFSGNGKAIVTLLELWKQDS